MSNDQAFPALRLSVMRWLLRANRIAVEARHQVDLSRSFDIGHYIDHSSDVTAIGIPALDHYLYYGSKEGRNPHPLFACRFYLERYPDVRKAGIEPFVHYLVYGWKEGRDPHPAFCGQYYLAQAPSLLRGSMSPISHYLRSGWKLNLAPHPLFDGGRYLASAPDVRVAGMNPLLHYLFHGREEGRRIYPSSADPGQFRESCVAFRAFLASTRNCRPRCQLGPRQVLSLDNPKYVVRESALLDGANPSQMQAPAAAPAEEPIDVIVPCYGGVDETARCFESLLASGGRTPMELIAIDDASPEPALSNYLQHLAIEGRITLIRSKKNRGFVSSVNAGLALHPLRDVVVLNSDTIVSKGWVDRLTRAAYSVPNAATVTPLSNNATICSYPAFGRENSLPAGLGVDSIDRLAAEVNRGRMVEIPTAVGFCMFIRRTCLNDIGFFDASAFGRGYGEENDFCMRATRRGWSHWLALDLFVFHFGGASFLAESADLQAEASKTILARYPEYGQLVARHVELNPAAPSRIALTAAIYRSSGKPVVLLVTHAGSAAIEAQVFDCQFHLGPDALTLFLRPTGPCQVTLSVPGHVEDFLFQCDRQGVQELANLLRLFGLTHVHVHIKAAHTTDLYPIIDALNVPVINSAFDNCSAQLFVNRNSEANSYCQDPHGPA